MNAKAILVFCAQALFIQSTAGRCPSLTSYGAVKTAPTLPIYEGQLGYSTFGVPAVQATPTNGGVLPVASASAYPPELKLASETEYEGTLSVTGELPFIGTVGLEGVVPSAGKGIVNHACGNGPARITGTNLGPYSNSALVSASTASAVGIIPEAIASGPNFLRSLHASNAYGGSGEGNVAVFGQIPVAGDAAVAGQVPIMGSVNYNGAVPASGSVNISGKCNCDCAHV